MERKDFLFINQNGEPVQSVTVKVYLAGTGTLVAIYSDNGVTPYAPTGTITGDAYGNVYFYAADGRYDINVSGGSPTITSYWMRDVALNDAGQGSVVMAHTLQGSDASAKIIAAYALLPAAGGIVDARGLNGSQTFGTDFLAAITKPTTILLGAGTFTTVPLCPVASSGNVRLIGSGDATILIPSAANSACIGPATDVADNAYLAHFAVKAHASGSTGAAIDVRGFRGSHFDHITYQSNNGKDFAYFFYFSAVNYHTYNNFIDHLTVNSQTGPGTVVQFAGNAGDAAGNANVQKISNSFIYNNTGIATVFDVRQSDGVTIDGGDVEANCAQGTAPNCTVGQYSILLKPGNGTVLQNCYLETNEAATPVPIVPTQGTGTERSSYHVRILNNYWGYNTRPTLTLPSWTTDWQIFGNTGSSPDGFLVVDNTTDHSSVIIQKGQIGIGKPPATGFALDMIGSPLGIGGAGVAGNIRLRDDANNVRWYLGFPGSAGATSFILSDLVNSKTPLSVETNAPTNSLYIKSDGKVGIGTNTPALLLDVNSNALGVGAVSAASGFGGSLRIRDDTATAHWLTGLASTAAAVDYVIYNLVTNHTALTIASANDKATFLGQVFGGTPGASFNTTLKGYFDDSYLGTAINAFGVLNSSSADPIALLGINQGGASASGQQMGVVGVASSPVSTSNAVGVEGDGFGAAPSGTTASIQGVVGTATWQGAGTLTSLVSVHASTVSKSAGTVTNAYGILVDDVSAVGGTGNYAVYTGAGTVSLGDVLQLRSTTTAGLPSCVAGLTGAMRSVSDSDTQTWGATVVHTTGSYKVLAWCNGANWTVAGK